MKSLPRKYSSADVLDLITRDCDASASWQAVVKNGPPEHVENLKEALARIANAPRFVAELRKKPWQKQATRKRLSRMAATLERLAPFMEEAVAHPMVHGRLYLPMARHPEFSMEHFRAAEKWLAEIPDGVRWLAKAIRMSMAESKRKKLRLKDEVAEKTRVFMLGLEPSGLKFDKDQDFDDVANILRPVYRLAGLKASPPKPSRFASIPPDAPPTSESLKALRRRSRLPYRFPTR